MLSQHNTVTGPLVKEYAFTKHLLFSLRIYTSKFYYHWLIARLLIKQLNHFATVCHSHTKVFSAPNVHHDVILPKPLEPGLLYHKQTSGYHWRPEKHNPLSYIKLIYFNVNVELLRYLARNFNITSFK